MTLGQLSHLGTLSHMQNEPHDTSAPQIPPVWPDDREENIDLMLQACLHAYLVGFYTNMTAFHGINHLFLTIQHQ